MVLETAVVEQLIKYDDSSAHNPMISYQRPQYENRSGVDVRVKM
jgi:hypothetical protein